MMHIITSSNALPPPLKSLTCWENPTSRVFSTHQIRECQNRAIKTARFYSFYAVEKKVQLKWLEPILNVTSKSVDLSCHGFFFFGGMGSRLNHRIRISNQSQPSTFVPKRLPWANFQNPMADLRTQKLRSSRWGITPQAVTCIKKASLKISGIFLSGRKLPRKLRVSSSKKTIKELQLDHCWWKKFGWSVMSKALLAMATSIPPFFAALSALWCVPRPGQMFPRAWKAKWFVEMQLTNWLNWHKYNDDLELHQTSQSSKFHLLANSKIHMPCV